MNTESFIFLHLATIMFGEISLGNMDTRGTDKIVWFRRKRKFKGIEDMNNLNIAYKVWKQT